MVMYCDGALETDRTAKQGGCVDSILSLSFPLQMTGKRKREGRSRWKPYNLHIIICRSVGGRLSIQKSALCIEKRKSRRRASQKGKGIKKNIRETGSTIKWTDLNRIKEIYKRVSRRRVAGITPVDKRPGVASCVHTRKGTEVEDAQKK